MNKAYIYFYGENKDYSGEGIYILVFDDKEIASHFCSNRSFANHDLTVWQLDTLEKYNIDQVISNEKVVWSKDDNKVNKNTDTEFRIANDIYEAKYCR